MNSRILSLAVIAVLFSVLTTGVLGFKTRGECLSVSGVVSPTPGEIMLCYHQAALTAAYFGSEAEAINTCQEITQLAFTGDQKKLAENQRDQCLYDIAKITRQPSVCGNIQKKILKDDLGLVGGATTQELCKKEVARLRSPSFSSLCSFIFITPLILLFIRYSSAGSGY